MHVNGVRDLVRFPLDACSSDEKLMRSDGAPSGLPSPRPTGADGEEAVAGFSLDRTCSAGNVAMVFFPSNPEPQVWFQDLGCRWSYVAPTFTEYFRLLAMYRGVPNWQYAFTELISS